MRTRTAWTRGAPPAFATTLALALALLLVGCSALPTPSATPSPTAVPTALPTPSLSPVPPTVTPPPLPDEIPPAWLDGGVFSASYPQAYALLRTMTLEELVGQVLLARIAPADQTTVIADLHLGGLTLFAVDFKDRTKDQVVAAIAADQAAARIPLAISTDEEGGTVVRVSGFPLLAATPFASPSALYAKGGFDALAADADAKAALLLALGINLNLAPVADVSTVATDFMYPRALDRPADLTAQFVARVVGVDRAAGLSSTLKHFPGYGNNPDTHVAGAVDSRPLSTFESSDFLPFQAGIDAGAECVMVSHLIVACLDPVRPASLSPAVHAYLRDRLRFTGIIVSDSLDMGAISDFTEGRDPHVEALLAGNDLLCTTTARQGCDALLTAVRDGDLPLPTLEHAVFRVLAWKISRGIVPD